MDKQVVFHFVPVHGEPMNFARLGFAIDWRRVARLADRMILSQLNGTLPAQEQKLPVKGFELKRHFLEAALFEEIRSQSKRRARALKREARAKGRRLHGAVVQACLPEGRHAQRIIDALSDRIRERETDLLCG